MADEHQRRQQVDNLVAQDMAITDNSMKEFRMQLEQRLADWERRQARLWRILCVAGAAYLLEMLFAFAYLNRIPADAQRYYVIPFMAISWLTFIVLLYSAALYLGKYMPAIRRMRYDIQTAMILELQAQVMSLREEVRKQNSRNAE